MVVLTLLFVFVNLGGCKTACGINAADIPTCSGDALESFWATDELQQIETEW